MKCGLCGSEKVNVIYEGPVRTGKRDGYTKKKYPVYQCDECKTIWNYSSKDYPSDYYETTEYRDRIEQGSEIEKYYELHDGETLRKFKMTGTEIFRGKTVCDVGCAGGSFLDFLQGVSKEIIAIEPSKEYQKTLKDKYHTYSYAKDAMIDWEGKVDVVTSFDVIEHVPDPYDFLNDCYKLLKKDGSAIIGTPTDYPVLRQMLGDDFNKFVFSIHHPWVLSRTILEKMAKDVGFREIKTESIQLYGIGNLLSWLLDREPKGDKSFDFISESLNTLYKREMESNGYGEYIVLKVRK